jgi:hypothetical protein
MYADASEAKSRSGPSILCISAKRLKGMVHVDAVVAFCVGGAHVPALDSNFGHDTGGARCQNRRVAGPRKAGSTKEGGDPMKLTWLVLPVLIPAALWAADPTATRSHEDSPRASPRRSQARVRDVHTGHSHGRPKTYPHVTSVQLYVRDG